MLKRMPLSGWRPPDLNLIFSASSEIVIPFIRSVLNLMARRSLRSSARSAVQLAGGHPSPRGHSRTKSGHSKEAFWRITVGGPSDELFALLERSVMLAAARYANPDGITLFSSRNPQNTRTNAQLLSSNTDLRAAGTFATLVARDAAEFVGHRRNHRAPS